MTEHGLRIAATALVFLAVAQPALADDGAPVGLDPLAMATALASSALAELPLDQPLDPVAVVADVLPVVPVTPPASEAVASAQPPAAAPETVPAAAAEPILAMEPHPSPPPAQSEAPGDDPLEYAPAVSPEEVLAPALDTETQPVDEPQYQPEPPQYQPPVAVVSPHDATPPVTTTPDELETEWNWDWTWSCGGSKPPVQPPVASDDVLPKNWNWNWDWNCDSGKPSTTNKSNESGAQYQPVITRYHPVNVNVSIRIASPGDDGPVTQTNVVLAVDAGPASATVQAAIPAPLPVLSADGESPEAALSDPPAATAPAATKPDASSKTKLASNADDTRGLLAAPVVASTEAPSWTARPVVPRRVQPADQEAHRSRSQLRKPTRRPLPQRRAPVIPMGSAGAAPLGGSDGGGFQIALLLVPFALALVDRAGRLVRDTTPPVARARSSRRERPG